MIIACPTIAVTYVASTVYVKVIEDKIETHNILQYTKKLTHLKVNYRIIDGYPSFFGSLGRRER